MPERRQWLVIDAKLAFHGGCTCGTRTRSSTVVDCNDYAGTGAHGHGSGQHQPGSSVVLDGDESLSLHSKKSNKLLPV